MSDNESEQLKQIASEYNADVEARHHKERSLADARRTAMYSSGLAMFALTFAITVARCVATFLTLQSQQNIDRISGTLCCFFVCWAIFALPIGTISGWLAHRIFYDTLIPVPRMAIVFSFIAVFTVFGWILVLTMLGR